MECSKDLTNRLQKLVQETGYQVVQQNGQRRFGPPPNWTGPPPPKGCEIFIGKLPREVFEDELVPIFARVGKIYEMRLMMDFSGSNRGYAFVTYTSPREAYKAIKELNNLEIRKGRHIGVVKSVDNCRLFIGNIPKDKTKEEIVQVLSNRVTNVVDVILYKNAQDRRLNRGFAFVEFTSHKAAAMARRTLVPGCVKLWDREVVVDWAEPEPDIDDEQMKTVKVLYVRNFLIKTLPEDIQKIFETAINAKIQRVKKMYDYAFVHFYEREHAELAMKLLQNIDIDGSNIEIHWAKPVVKELYHIQKMKKGNAKFNVNLDFSQTLLLYKQQLEKKEYSRYSKDARSSKDDGIGSTCAGAESVCGSPADADDVKSTYEIQYPLAPAKLDSICKRYMWAPPVYSYQRHIDPAGAEIWIGKIELPCVGSPLMHVPHKIGPLLTSPCYSMEQAQVQAAEYALRSIKLLQSALSPVQLYQSIPQIQNCFGLPSYSQMYTNPVTTLPLPMQTFWRNV